MADVLTGYTWDRSASRYRSGATGRYVARSEIVNLLGTHISGGESRVEALTRAMFEGTIAPATFAEQMRTQLRRLHLQNAALGTGGWDRLRPADYGRIGQRLREDYVRINKLINDVQNGNATIAQALNRANGYVGNSRIAFWETERASQSVPEPGKVIIERRVLGAHKNCRDCLNYYAAGWQPIGVLPLPALSCACGTNCKCRMERRQVPADEAGQYVKRSLADVIAADGAKRAAALEAKAIKKAAKADGPKEKKSNAKVTQKVAKVDSATTLDQLRQRVSTMPEDKALGELAKLNTKINKAENAGNDKLSEQLQDQRRVYLQVLGNRRKIEDDARKAEADLQRAERERKQAEAAAIKAKKDAEQAAIDRQSIASGKSILDILDEEFKGKDIYSGNTEREYRSRIESLVRDQSTLSTTGKFHGMTTDVTMRGFRFGRQEVYFENATAAEKYILQLHDARINKISLPPVLNNATQRIYFTSQSNSDDEYWRQKYKNFTVSAATGGDGNIVIYNGESLDIGSYAHESGHNLAAKIYGNTAPSDVSRYRLAMRGEDAVSEYAKNSAAEDFAESVRMYVTNGSYMKMVAPQRYAIIDKILKDGYE